MQKKICAWHNENVFLMEYLKNDKYMHMHMPYPSIGVTLKQEKNKLAI